MPSSPSCTAGRRLSSTAFPIACPYCGATCQRRRPDPVTSETVIPGIGGIDAVREFLVGARGRRRLGRELAAMVAHDHAIAGVRLHRAKLKPGRKLSGWYTVDVAGVDGGRWRWEVAVTWVPAADGRRDGGDAGAARPARNRPERS